MVSMNAIAQALADPTIRGWYLGFCLALILLPMVGLWLFYRKRLKANAVDRAMFVRVSLLTLLWMAANAAAFGLLMWANTVNSRRLGNPSEGIVLGLAARGEELTRRGKDHWAQERKRDQVGDRHERVQHVGKQPHEAQLHGGADDGRQRPHDAERDDGLDPEQKLPGALAVIAPAEQRGEGEDRKRQ